MANQAGSKEREDILRDAARQQFVSDLSLMRERAVRLGFYATAHRLDRPIRMVGFELSGEIEACEQYEQDLEKATR